MKFAIVCVNYNSYDSLKNYLGSIEKAVVECGDEVTVSVYIADNSTIKETIDVSLFKHLQVKTYNYDNVGYLGGAFNVINSLKSADKQQFDFFAITNVDVTVREDFFIIFKALSFPDNVAWVAPKIFLTSLNKVGNIEMDKRPSVCRMRFYNLLYSSVLVFKAYYYLSRLWIRSTSNNKKESQEIYSGYGSFMIFSSRFINSCDKWIYPPFLFGEELFFAEMAKLRGMKVIYEPDLKIYDIGKVSTGKITSRKKLKMQKDSNLYLYNEFFSNRK